MIHSVFLLFLFAFCTTFAAEDSFSGLYEHAHFRWFICMPPKELYDGAKEVEALEKRLPRVLKILQDLKIDVEKLKAEALQDGFTLYDPKDPRWVVQAHALCYEMRKRKRQLKLPGYRS